MINENGIMFLGTGSSSSTPKLAHIFKNNNAILKEEHNGCSGLELSKEDLENVDRFVSELASKNLECVDELNNLYLRKVYSNYSNIKCYTCFDALNNNSKNKRNNICVSLKSNESYVLIDVGKTFRESILFNRHKINFYNINLEAILLTHSHTDAINGIDDLRDLQVFDKISYDDIYYYAPRKFFNVYLNEATYYRILNSYKYLAEKRTKNKFYSKVSALNMFILKDEKYNKLKYDENGSITLKEPTGKLNINNTDNKGIDKENEKKIDEKEIDITDDNDSINIRTYNVKDEYGFIYLKFDKDKVIRFIPVEHGKNYICIGYIIGNKNKLLYISDCSNLPSYVLQYIKKFEPIDTLIIDASFYKIKHYSHISLCEGINIALNIKPKKVYFVGMSCYIEHNITNLYLQKLSSKFPDISFSLAYDGLFINFDF